MIRGSIGSCVAQPYAIGRRWSGLSRIDCVSSHSAGGMRDVGFRYATAFGG